MRIICGLCSSVALSRGTRQECLESYLQEFREGSRTVETSPSPLRVPLPVPG